MTQPPSVPPPGAPRPPAGWPRAGAPPTAPGYWQGPPPSPGGPSWGGQPPDWSAGRPRRPRWVVPALLAGLAVVGLIVLGVVFFAMRGWFGAPGEWVLTVGPGGDLTEVALTVGDCADVDPFDAQHLDASTAVPCTNGHALEVVARDDLLAPTGVLAAPSPLDDAVLDAAERWCLTSFELYVDVDFFVSRLDYLTLVPDEARWAAGDREIICVAIPWEDQILFGSVRGTQQ